MRPNWPPRWARQTICTNPSARMRCWRRWNAGVALQLRRGSRRQQTLKIAQNLGSGKPAGAGNADRTGRDILVQIEAAQRQNRDVGQLPRLPDELPTVRNTQIEQNR